MKPPFVGSIPTRAAKLSNKYIERFKVKVAVYIIFIKEKQVLLSRRFNTGWQDGNYGLPSGHVEANETIIKAVLREALEETGVKLDQQDITFVHAMYRKSAYVDFYFQAKKWVGNPKNTELNKCDDLKWVPMDSLPANMVPSVKFAIQNYKNGVQFSDFDLEV